MTELADREYLEALLRRLEATWADLGVDLSERLLPGYSDDEIRDWFSLEGLEPPTEALAWWGWHGDVAPGFGCTLPPTNLQFVPLDMALTDYRWFIDAYEELPGAKRLFPLASLDRYNVWMHLDVPSGAVSPLREFHLEDADSDLDFVMAPSLTWLVGRWMRVLQSGLCIPENGLVPTPLAVKMTIGFPLTSWFGERVLSPLRHDPPPMDID